MFYGMITVFFREFKSCIIVSIFKVKKRERQTANISDFSSGHDSKYEFLMGKDVFLEKDLLEKAATIKIFEYLVLVKFIKINKIHISLKRFYYDYLNLKI